MARAKGRTQNPKFEPGANAQQVGIDGGSGMNVGGLTDAQVRRNVVGQGKMLHLQLRKNRSTGLKVP